MTFSAHIETPLGTMLAVFSEQPAVKKLSFFLEDTKPSPLPAAMQTFADEIQQQLKQYFAGILKTFSLPMAPEGTDFEKRTWALLLEIPWGTTTSYGEIARKLGDPKLSRAVGRANGANPIAICIPCHRVIGASGDLTGYGGGLDKKKALLKIESPQRELF